MRSIVSIIPADPGSVNPNGINVSQQWRNGGKCEISACKDAAENPCRKEDGKVKVGTWSGGKNRYETICCSLTNAPSSCEWRGGESRELCNGQCHKGGINLNSIRGSDGNGTHHHCTSGWQIFCCKAVRWATLIEQCQFAKCGKDCDSGCEEITTAYTTSECNTGTDQGSPLSALSTGYRKYCCPKPGAFKNCPWSGKGDCR